MDALKERDKLFAEIHTSLLKPIGFKKKGNWSVRTALPFHWAVYLRSSRWSRRDNANFWIDLYVYHEPFDSLVFGPRSFPGPSERIPGLVAEDLGKIVEPHLPTFEINSETNIDTLREELLKAVSERALPLFSRCDSLEKIAEFQNMHHWPGTAIFVAGIYLLLGQKEKAEEAMAQVRMISPNDNIREFNERRWNKMLANSALNAVAARGLA
jgi:hypothetical protein